MTLSNEDVASFIETQLEAWPLAKKNYDALRRVERRNEMVCGLDIGIQWNPTRIVSTGAKTDKDSIASRRCFLCRANRPKEQIPVNILPGWEMLVNPYPILPIHLTIVAIEHKPQSRVPEDIVALAESLPGMVIFFNGAKAGASAPDHMHVQAVLKDELPLLRLVERLHDSGNHGIMASSRFGVRLPYFFLSGVVAPDESGMSTLLAGLRAGGVDENGELTDPELVNSFFWIDNTGKLRFIVVPRKAHRPKCYGLAGEGKRVISPGCIDMAGLLIVPRESDYRELTLDEIKGIYSDVAITDCI